MFGLLLVVSSCVVFIGVGGCQTHLKVSDTRPGRHVKDADIRQPRFVAWLGCQCETPLYPSWKRYYVDLVCIYTVCIYIYVCYIMCIYIRIYR